MKEACGCGRAVGEVIRMAGGLAAIAEPVVGVGDPMAERVREMRAILRSNAGRWLSAVPRECGIDKALLAPVEDRLTEGSYDRVAVVLLDVLRDCAGMTY